MTSPPNGITENATKAGIVEMTGAMKYTRLSAITGMMSSLNASLSPSARLCSQPLGPTRLGPGRCCMRPTTLRSQLIMKRVSTTPSANSADDLDDDQPQRVVGEQLLRVREPAVRLGLPQQCRWRLR